MRLTSGSDRAPVLVHNADGVNPYGTEIAALLQRRGHTVTLVDATNGVHEPPAGIAWRRLLPANFGTRTRRQQVNRLIRGLGATLLAGGLRGDVVVVTSVRFTLENLVLAALASCGRPVVHVQHDPVRRISESKLSRWSRRQMLVRATVAVVHAERLRADIDPAAADRLVVCPHPPYSYTAPASPAASGDTGGRRWLAFIGNLRPDKGVDLVPEILDRVPEAQRGELGVVVCGRGRLDERAWQHVRDLGVDVEDMTSSEPVEHETLLAVLSARPLLLAPYVAATQSGSVILALTMGCRVLAFDKGGIPDVVTDDGLVPNGDLQAFADAVASGRSGTSRIPLSQWSETAADAWSDAVQLAQARPGERSRQAKRPQRLRRRRQRPGGRAAA